MNTKIRICGLLFAATTLAATAAPTASAVPVHDGCSRQLADSSRLPHAADAIEGWFQECHARHDRIPASADGAAGWFG
jgi:hypothetical protein